MTHASSQQSPDRSALLTALKRKPDLFIKWLYLSREMQISFAILALLLLIPIFAPQILDPILVNIFPPIAQKRLLGLVSGVTNNPNLDLARSVLQISLWLLWSGFLVVLLWRRLPGFATYSNRRAMKLEADADSMLKQRPADSLLLYNEARLWAFVPEHEATLVRKIESVNSLFTNESIPAGKTAEQTVSTSPTATVVINEEQTASDSGLIGGRYQILRRLGEGAMGIVYLAHDQQLERDVAVKQLSPGLIGNEELLARFRQEAKALARLVHPNIVQAYDFLEEEHRAWITMEYIEGQGLDTMLTDQPMDLTMVVGIIQQIAGAMSYAHSKGVVHRDLKPANILITADGIVKVMDFGVAKLNESSMLTRVGTIMGSPAFMSPEQASGGDVNDSTDIYALGIILYRMLTGQFPFKGDAKSIIAQHLTKIPDKAGLLRTDIPEVLEALIIQMLEKNPEIRPASMDEINNRLHTLNA